MKISLEALQLLDAIDLKGGFAAAAAALHRVPSAVTHAIRKLEDDLGVRLFDRSQRRARLTPAGRALLEQGRHLLRAAGELECSVQRIAAGWEAELRIAVEDVLNFSPVLALVAEFDGVHSGTRLRLSREVLGGCWDALITGRADLAIGAPGDAPPGARVSIAPLGAVTFAFTVPVDHPLAALPEPLSPDEVARYRAVAIADTSRELLARSAGLIGGQETLTVPDLASKRAAQVAGLGVGHLPRGVAEAEVAAGRLKIMRLAESRPPIPVSVAWRSGHTGRALAWFVDRLAEPAWRSALLPAGDPVDR